MGTQALEIAFEIYRHIEPLVNFVAPAEYGLVGEEKAEIGVRTISRLLRKILNDVTFFRHSPELPLGPPLASASFSAPCIATVAQSSAADLTSLSATAPVPSRDCHFHHQDCCHGSSNRRSSSIRSSSNPPSADQGAKMLDDQDNSGSSLSPGRVLTPESRPMQSGKEIGRRVFIGNGGGL